MYVYSAVVAPTTCLCRLRRLSLLQFCLTTATVALLSPSDIITTASLTPATVPAAGNHCLLLVLRFYTQLHDIKYAWTVLLFLLEITFPLTL